jgi:uncharacterized protein (TIGR00369 family)
LNRVKDDEYMPIDVNTFFHDEDFAKTYPAVKVPPPCFTESGASIIAHEANKSLTIDFPVRETQTNPLGYLQGGILCSMFDNTFGPLAFATMRKPSVSIGLTINFVRPVKPGEIVRIRAEFRAKSRTLLQLSAEAFNEKQKLLATASTSMMVIDI